MTHLPYIAAAYALGIVVPAAFGISAWARSATARRRLRAIDPRFQARQDATRVRAPQDATRFRAPQDATPVRAPRDAAQ